MTMTTADADTHSLEQNFQMLRDSSVFDADWYLLAYPDVQAAGTDPLRHYLEHGVLQGRDPSAAFDTRFYLASNPDVAQSPFNPLVHYLLHGRSEGRRPRAEDAANGNFALYPSETLNRHGLEQVTRQLAADATPAEELALLEDGGYAPLVTIIMPVFNTPPRFLREAVQSVRAQTYGAWRLCVVDDCSTQPETLSILDELRADSRLDVIRLETNQGIAKASHAALLAATGDYVAFLDHDDLLTPNALSEVVAKLREDPSIDYVYSDHVQADARGLPFALSRKPDWSPEFLLSTNYIVHFKVVRRELLVSAGGLAEERSQVQDIAMSLRLARSGANVKHIPKGLYFWREHQGSVAASTTAKPGIEHLIVETYNEHLSLTGGPAEAFWPRRWREDRVGAFQLAFSDPMSSVALVMIEPATAGADPLLRQDHDVLAASGVAIHTLDAATASDARGTRAFFASLAAEHVVLFGSGRLISPGGLRDLVGYLSLSHEIGAAGGKVLDSELRVVAGGLLLTRRAEYKLICGGEYDNAAGHWLVGQLASNVDAVSSRCMAVRRRDLVEGPGLRLSEWGDLAGVVLSQDLRSRGQRIVFNPQVKVFDPTPVKFSTSQFSELAQRARAHIPHRVFKEFDSASG